MTFSNFLAYIKRTVKRTDKDTEIAQAYNDTIVDIATRMPSGNYKYQSYCPTVAGQEDYALPTNLVHLFHPIRLLDGNATEDSGAPLIHMTKEAYDEREAAPNRSGPDSGYPTSYCIWSRSILLTPIPDDVYLLEINWSKMPLEQSDDYTVHFLGDEYNEVLKFGTIFRFYADLDLYNEAAQWRALYEDDLIGLPKLLRKERDIEGNVVGRVKTNSL